MIANFTFQSSQKIGRVDLPSAAAGNGLEDAIEIIIKGYPG
jgi:hypothetical protein